MQDQTAWLVERVGNGDRDAVDPLLEKYLPGLRAFLRLRSGKLLRDKESVSDLAQSVCRDVIENLGRFRYTGEAAFKQWLFTTAARKVADRYEYWNAAKRDARREVAQPGDIAATQADKQLLDAYGAFCSPSRHAIAREELARVENAFEQLPEDQREVVILARLVGMSRAEIAEQTGRTEGAVRTLLWRALARLAEILDDHSSIT